MKKIIAVILSIVMVLLTFSSCAEKNENIVIAKDYMTITFNGAKYKLSDYSIAKPEDCVEYNNPVVEGENWLYYLLPICGDVIYYSEKQPEYLWLVTERDVTFDERFAQIREKNYELIFVRENAENLSVDNDKNSLSEKLDAVVSSYNFNGIAAVFYNDEKIYEANIGYADRDKKRVNSTKDIYRIASLTKQFTAAAICMLCEKGKLEYNETIDNYFPDAKFGANVRIIDLLNMSSGIPNYSGSTDEDEIQTKGTYTEKKLGFEIKENNTAEENKLNIERWILSQSLQFTPHDKLDYSNSNYFLLGRIIEKVSGLDYESFITKNIIEPLNLTDTSFDNSDITAKGYVYDSIVNEAKYYENNDMQWVFYSGAFFASAGLNSSVEDLYKWISALRKGQVVSKETFEEMIEVNNVGYGMGFFTNKVACFHTGHLGSYVSYLGFARDMNFVVITISNTYNGDVDFSQMSIQLGNLALEILNK